MRRFDKSEEYLVRAERSIPLGSQTFSKSRTQFPRGVSPFAIQRGQGSHVWDVDGNEYVDFINGLCAINLGYRDSDVDAAVRAQLEEGVIFSLPHPIEAEVAEKLIEMVPCAEKVRFGKNGSDATAGAIRVARAYTGRDRVAVCGYHGWQDWYIGSTLRNRGVPASTSALTHVFQYNDAKSLDELLRKHSGEFAAVILEPMNVVWPDEGFLEEVKALTAAAGAVLIFDETITGFRYAPGGAQQLFGVTPDLATFGKGMANGYAISAVTGRADIMKQMEEVFFSFTFGGETLSLAASLATMKKIQSEPVVRTMTSQGEKVQHGLRALIAELGAADFLRVDGHPTWSFLSMADVGKYSSWELKTLLMQESHEAGVLTFGTHNLSYSHSDADIEHLLSCHRATLTKIVDAVRNERVHEVLSTSPLEPLFKVR